MLGLLLPLAAAGVAPPAASADTSFTSLDALERATSQALVAAVAGGATLADVEEHDAGVMFTLVERGAARRLIVDTNGYDHFAYHVEPAELPTGPGRVDPYLARGLAAGDGGITLNDTCGTWFVDAYRRDHVATGADAVALVGDTFTHAIEMTSASIADDHAGFGLYTNGLVILEVTLDDHHRVIAAEVRRSAPGLSSETTYARMRALKRAVRHHAVAAIHDDLLELDDGRTFAIDPRGDAFVDPPREPGDCGC
jgi:hypothetical protein